MNRFGLLIIITFIILGSSVAILILQSHGNLKFYSPVGKSVNLNQGKKNNNVLGVLKDYTDSSGFKFRYPSSIELTNNNINDSSIFSSINLSSASGKITIAVKETSFDDIDSYIRNSKEIKDAKKTKLGNLEAREYILDENLITAAIDQKVLFLITEKPDERTEFWNSTKKEITESFQFVEPSDSNQTQDNSSSDVVDEGEEVVQ